MVFVTAGTQLPFDRLIEAVDDIASMHPDVQFVVQALSSRYKAKHVEVVDFLSSQEFDQYFKQANMIISHAGMGTIISALVKKKPIIVMPRQYAFNEHRNDHQVGTAKQMEANGYVYVAYDSDELKTLFKNMWPDNLNIRATISDVASDEIIQSLNDFIKSK
ncbi:glycosyl transferase family 28 [Mucilaginibacter conchicola]|uniref:Glycosyl transferase family 28 n=1 Tax=Mucilaginibacter conchicola TaxID=2303333 RepID=A0A372NXS2_9SPHI|nr:PssE/Cps14G family polysaccharide biosynthesis glycosyltransferase [Mucilaginibacter conchicola]RFZ94842.1 glycosyl transferase family 28 [Mucilaginibacter conchicola]